MLRTPFAIDRDAGRENGCSNTRTTDGGSGDRSFVPFEVVGFQPQ